MLDFDELHLILWIYNIDVTQKSVFYFYVCSLQSDYWIINYNNNEIDNVGLAPGQESTYDKYVRTSYDVINHR